MTLGRSTLQFAGLWAILHAIEVALVGVALSVPVRKLLLPYLLLFWCGVFAAVLFYWAREPVDQPPTAVAPARFAIALFTMLNMYEGALLVGAVAIGVLTKASALREWAPYIVPSSLVIAISMYFTARRRVRAA
jgi:hypothetical protein